MDLRGEIEAEAEKIALSRGTTTQKLRSMMESVEKGNLGFQVASDGTSQPRIRAVARDSIRSSTR